MSRATRTTRSQSIDIQSRIDKLLSKFDPTVSLSSAANSSASPSNNNHAAVQSAEDETKYNQILTRVDTCALISLPLLFSFVFFSARIANIIFNEDAEDMIHKDDVEGEEETPSFLNGETVTGIDSIIKLMSDPKATVPAVCYYYALSFLLTLILLLFSSSPLRLYCLAIRT
jgi:hypothetical protein